MMGVSWLTILGGEVVFTRWASRQAQPNRLYVNQTEGPSLS
jgi:hypothetical protein